MKLRRIACKLGAGCFTTAILIIFIELISAGILTCLPQNPSQPPPPARRTGTAPLLMEAPQYLTDDPLTLSTLKPGFQGMGQGVPVRINAKGLRGPEIPESNPDPFRILCLGDSITFGWGVEEINTYPAQLQSILMEEHPDTPIEVINAGIPTQTSYQGYLRLKHTDLLKSTSADLVIICYGFNDQTLHKESDRVRSRLVRIENHEPGIMLQMLRKTNTYQGLKRLFRPLIATRSSVSKERKVRVPEKEFYENIVEMIRIVRSNEAKPILMNQIYARFTPSAYNKNLSQAAEEMNISCIDVLDALQAASRNLPAGESIFLDDCHPTALGCRAIAQKTARSLHDSIP